MRRPGIGGIALAAGVVTAGGLLVVAVATSIIAVEERAPVAMELTRRALADGSIEERGAVSGVVLTSDRFRPTITFEIASLPMNDQAEFCFLRSSANEIVLQHLRGCVDELRIIHPLVTDCGGQDDQPDSGTLAAAMLARPGLGAKDLGPIVPGENVPATLFAIPVQGRVMEIPGGRAFDDDVNDPDGCRLLFDATAEPNAVEIRGDMSDRFVLVDHRGELIVIRAGTGGHDARSGKDAHQRGYGSADAELFDHMIESIEMIGLD
jgi:hypothetical protein